jgi:ABC-type multidrug transport system permease subunit
LVSGQPAAQGGLSFADARRLFLGMAVRGGAVLVGFFAVLVSGLCVGFGFFVLALRMMVCRLMMMVSSGLMSGSGILMMLVRRVFG